MELLNAEKVLQWPSWHHLGGSLGDLGGILAPLWALEAQLIKRNHASEWGSRKWMHMLSRGVIIEVNEDGASGCRSGLAVALLASSSPTITQVNEDHASEWGWCKWTHVQPCNELSYKWMKMELLNAEEVLQWDPNLALPQLGPKPEIFGLHASEWGSCQWMRSMQVSAHAHGSEWRVQPCNWSRYMQVN